MGSKRKVESYHGQIKMRFKIKSNCMPRPSSLSRCALAEKYNFRISSVAEYR